MDDAERLALGVVDAERKRRLRVPGAELLEIDGLVLALSNVADPALNSIVVEREPADARALRAAERAFGRRGHPLGIDFQVGRHASIDEAVRDLGLTRIIERPGMAVDTAGLAQASIPEGVEVRAVSGEADAKALVDVGVLAFGDDPDAAGRFYAAGSFGVEGAKSFVAWEAGRPVAIAGSYLHEGAVASSGWGSCPQCADAGSARRSRCVRPARIPEPTWHGCIPPRWPPGCTGASASGASRTGRCGSGGDGS